MPPIIHSFVAGLAYADREIRYNDIDLNEGYVIHIFFDKESINHSAKYIEIWVPLIFYILQIHVHRVRLKDVTDFIPSKTRIL